MDAKKYSITSKQLMTIIISSQIGLGILTFPSDIAKITGHDSWISVILGGMIFMILTALMVLLLKHYGSKSIIQINKDLFGNLWGNLVNIIFLLFFGISAINGVRLYCEFIKLTVLTNTPSLLLTCFIMLPIFYTAWNGLKSFARFSAINYIGLTLTLILIALIFKQFNFSFLEPVGSSGISSISQGTFSTVYALLGPELVGILFPYVSDKKKVLKYTFFANLITTSFYVIVVISTTSLFGENMLQELVIPLIKLSRTYYAPIFERIDLFYFALWVPNIALSTGGYFITAEIAVRQFLNINKHDKLELIIFTVIIIGLSRIPAGLNQESLLMNIISIFGLTVIGIMVLDYIISFYVKRGVK